MASNKRHFSNDVDTEEDVEIKRRYQCLDPEDLLRSIQGTFALDTSEALFSIGDKIDLTNTDSDTSHERRGPVTIRWDSRFDQSHVRKMSFPTPQNQIATTDSLAQLLEDCKPATFGRGNQEVLDKSYRLASKMDVQHFSCDYSPYDNRVIEKVSQALAFRDGSDNSHRSLQAELYKLNVSPSVLLEILTDLCRRTLLTTEAGLLRTFRHVQGACGYAPLRGSDGVACGLSSNTARRYVILRSGLFLNLKISNNANFQLFRWRAYYSAPRSAERL